MPLIKSEFPHPILVDGRDDYISGLFDIEIEVKDSSNYHILNVGYILNECNGLKNLILEGKAKVYFKIYCKSTHFRKIYDLGKHNQKEISIDKFSLAKSFKTECYIVSRGTHFTLPELNPNYFLNQSFLLRNGDILAFVNGPELTVDDSEFRKPLSSIFNIVIDPSVDSLDVDFQNDVIHIRLNQETHNSYNTLKDHQLQRKIDASIVYPILIEALSLMVSKDDDDCNFSVYNWWGVIASKFEQMFPGSNLSEYSLSFIANKMLNNIVNESVNYFAQREKQNLDDSDDD